MDDITLHEALRWFPLVGRARPACRRLPDRVREITQLAEAAAQPGANVLSEASHALNKAALLASDCGLPEMARDLCLQHIDAYLQADHPFTVAEARGILGPALNLARLSLRAHDPAGTLQRLDSIYQGLTQGNAITLDGREISLSGLVGTRAEIRQLREDIWLQYLSESIRAYAQLDQWDLAAKHAEAHRGIGAHLMDGRQAAIITLIVSGDREGARRLLAETTITEPWEQQVATCLNVLCATETGADVAIRLMTNAFLEAEPIPGYIVFRTRLALTISAIAGETHPQEGAQVAAKIADEVIDSGDGYAVRDLLSSVSLMDVISWAQEELLLTRVSSAGIDDELIHEAFKNKMRAITSMLSDFISEFMAGTR